MVFAILGSGALTALFVCFCILVVGFLVHLFTERNVLSAYRFLVAMVLPVPVFLMYNIFRSGMGDGWFSIVVSGYLTTAVIISFLGRLIERYNSEERE